MTNKILTTSGFILPNNPHYTPFKKSDNPGEDILNRNLVTSRNSSVLDFFGNNEVCVSYAVNNLYKSYLADPSYDNFIKLVDIACEIIKDVDLKTFIQWQVYGMNNTNISLSFCKDLIDGTLVTSYNSYNVIPSGSRFVVNNNRTKQEADKAIRDIEKNYYSYNSINWNNLISGFMDNRNLFITFYKYIFTDYY